MGPKVLYFFQHVYPFSDRNLYTDGDLSRQSNDCVLFFIVYTTYDYSSIFVTLIDKKLLMYL